MSLRGFAAGLKVGQDFSAPIANGIMRGYELEQEQRRQQFYQALAMEKMRMDVDATKYSQAQDRTNLMMNPAFSPTPKPYADTMQVPGALGGGYISRNQGQQSQLDFAKQQAIATGQIGNQFQAEDEARKLLNENLGFTTPISQLPVTQGPTLSGQPLNEMPSGFAQIPGTDQALNVAASNEAIIKQKQAERAPVGKMEILKNKTTGQQMGAFIGVGQSVPEGWEIYAKPLNVDKPSTIRKEIGDDDIIKAYRETNKQVARLEQAMAEARSGKAESLVVVDQALISVFNKMLDPDSVVRESEYARTPSDQALLNQIKGKWEQIKTGGAGLTNVERESIYRMAKHFHESQSNAARMLVDQYKQIAQSAGYDPKLIIPADLDAAVSGGQASGTPSTADDLSKKYGL